MPTCQKEFPIGQQEEHKNSRRAFSKTLALSLVAAGSGLLLRSKLTGTELDHPRMQVASASELEVGDYKLFRYPMDEPCILVRITENEYVAYSQSCTHLMCPIHYNKENQQFVCPCHQGFFDAKDGSVISGPPPRALPRYRVSVEDGIIWVG